MQRFNATVMCLKIPTFVVVFTAGYIMNRFPEYHNLILFAQMFSLGVFTALTAHAPSLIGFFVIVFFVGALVASCHTGTKLLKMKCF